MGSLISKLDLLEGRARPGTIRYKIDTAVMAFFFVTGVFIIAVTPFNWLLGNGDAEGLMTGVAGIFAATIIRRNRRIRELEEG